MRFRSLPSQDRCLITGNMSGDRKDWDRDDKSWEKEKERRGQAEEKERERDLLFASWCCVWEEGEGREEAVGTSRRDTAMRSAFASLTSLSSLPLKNTNSWKVVRILPPTSFFFFPDHEALELQDGRVCDDVLSHTLLSFTHFTHDDNNSSNDRMSFLLKKTTGQFSTFDIPILCSFLTYIFSSPSFE